MLPVLRSCAERIINDGKVNLETTCEGGAVPIPSNVKVTLFRMVRKRLLTLARRDCDGFGLVGMRKRAESISAAFRIESAPSAGTHVEVRAPARSRFEIVEWTTRLFSL